MWQSTRQRPTPAPITETIQEEAGSMGGIRRAAPKHTGYHV